jgi:uncharacterized protein
MSGRPGAYTPAADASGPGTLLERYLRLTREALSVVRPGVPERSFLRGGSEDVLSMARSYLADAEHFRESGDRERALAAVSYAHGWLDAGVRLGLLDGRDDGARFTLFR